MDEGERLRLTTVFRASLAQAEKSARVSPRRRRITQAELLVINAAYDRRNAHDPWIRLAMAHSDE